MEKPLNEGLTMIPEVMYRPEAHFEGKSQMVRTGGGEFSDPRWAKSRMADELQEGVNLGLKPVRGVVVQLNDGEEFCSHIIPIAFE